jgi:hypothetical protein
MSDSRYLVVLEGTFKYRISVCASSETEAIEFAEADAEDLPLFEAETYGFTNKTVRLLDEDAEVNTVNY